MIDKSIRQHYDEGKKVNVIQEGIDKFTGNVKKNSFLKMTLALMKNNL